MNTVLQIKSITNQIYVKRVEINSKRIQKQIQAKIKHCSEFYSATFKFKLNVKITKKNLEVANSKQKNMRRINKNID